MQAVKTANPNFTILVDYYPYTNTKAKLKSEFQSWFDYKKNKNLDISNYDLESDEANSLRSSLESKLINGNFSFLYYKDECLGFCGLQIQDYNAWIHRLFTNPTQYINYLGTFSQYVIPYQITIAKQLGCRYYKLTYNGRNERFYYFYRDKKFQKSKYYKDHTLSGVKNLSNFEFIGYEIINNTRQLVARLDLNRSDLDQFCKF